MRHEALEGAVINVADLPEQELVVATTSEKLTRAKSLSDAFGLAKLLVHQEVLLPGRRASGFHYHSEKEELFYVLSGTPSICVGEEVTDLEPGDIIGFKPLPGQPHMMLNRSQEPAVILTIGTDSETDVITYSDQNTVHH